MTGSSLWDGSYNEKVRGTGQAGGFPLFTASLLRVSGTLFSCRQPPQAHLPGQREMVFQRLSSLLKLNSIPNPHFKPGIILPPAPLSPHLQADGARHPLPALRASTEEEGRKKTARQRQPCLESPGSREGSQHVMGVKGADSGSESSEPGRRC